MAIVKCPECGKMISEYSEKCPYCACPMEKIKSLTSNADSETHNEHEIKCWFCGQRRATTIYKHTFVEKQYYSTAIMRKRRTLTKDVTIPCCKECKDSIELKESYGFLFAIIGTASIIIPLDYWLYTIEPGFLIAAIAFELAFIAAVIAALFYNLGEYVWKMTHKHLNAMLKKDIDEHQARKDLEDYSMTHPLTRPTISEFFGVK